MGVALSNLHLSAADFFWDNWQRAKWTPDRDLDAQSDFQGKVALIVGASAGIGTEILRQLLRGCAKVYVFARNRSKMERVLASVEEKMAKLGQRKVSEVVLLDLDLADLSSIRRAFTVAWPEVRPKGEGIDYVFLNAGTTGSMDGKRSADGYELSFATNSLGLHACLRHLAPALIDVAQSRNLGSSVQPKLSSASPRVILTSSAAHASVYSLSSVLPAKDNLPEAKGVNLFSLYARSKLLNIYDTTAWSRELAPRGVVVCSNHPGIIATEISREAPKWAQSVVRALFHTPVRGAVPAIWAAVKLDAERASGAYVVPPGKLRTPSKLARNEDAVKEVFAYLDLLVEAHAGGDAKRAASS